MPNAYSSTEESPTTEYRMFWKHKSLCVCVVGCALLATPSHLTIKLCVATVTRLFVEPITREARTNNMLRLFASAIFVVANCAGMLGQAVQTDNLLPAPTGLLTVGRVSYYWIDSARPEPLAQEKHAYRELMVDVWYPAKTVAAQPPAPYLPDLAAAEANLGQAEVKAVFGDAFTQVLEGHLYTHAEENAAFAASLSKCPVLIFSHGLGMLKTDYTSVIEDLVSHGYVVASIAHTYDTKIVAFPDGRVVQFDEKGRQAHGGSDEESIEYGNERSRVWAADIRFVIDELARYDSERGLDSPLFAHLDMARIGAFGHSDGGRAAALACQTDHRIRACLDMDGVADNLPFYRDVQGHTMAQPFLLFARPRKVPTEHDAAKMGYTRDQLEQLGTAVVKKQTDLLTRMPGGAYRVTISTPGVIHMSFSDAPLIEQDNDTTRGDALSALTLIREYTLAFFNEALLHKRSPLLGEAAAERKGAEVEWFPPPH
jgi:hypothetical protein